MPAPMNESFQGIDVKLFHDLDFLLYDLWDGYKQYHKCTFEVHSVQTIKPCNYCLFSLSKLFALTKFDRNEFCGSMSGSDASTALKQFEDKFVPILS